MSKETEEDHLLRRQIFIGKRSKKKCSRQFKNSHGSARDFMVPVKWHGKGGNFISLSLIYKVGFSACKFDWDNIWIIL
jgi:hypothetical protein